MKKNTFKQGNIVVDIDTEQLVIICRFLESSSGVKEIVKREGKKDKDCFAGVSVGGVYPPFTFSVNWSKQCFRKAKGVDILCIFINAIFGERRQVR